MYTPPLAFFLWPETYTPGSAPWPLTTFFEATGYIAPIPEGSAAARWSYTATATHWALSGRDDWTRQATYERPVTLLCDYKIESVKAMDAEGEEFTAKLVVYTGRANIKRGDYVLIGTSSSLSPIGVEGAREVRMVTRYADTFDRVADDFMLQTI